MKHNILKPLVFCGLIAFTLIHAQEKIDWDYVNQIQTNIQIPEFATQQFNILDFGAIGNGEFDCSDAIEIAISKCHESGGGMVNVPAGDFLTGAIHLKSDVNLHLQEGATLLFSTKKEDYLPVVYSRFEGVECMNYSPMIYAFQQENVAITGTGKLDGQSDNDNWWPWAGNEIYGWKSGTPSQFKDRDDLFEMAEKNVPVAERIFGEGHFLRPNFIQLYQCKNILIEDVQIVNSPMWEVHPVLCENVTVKNIHVKSHGPNNDGCNPESCIDVLIQGCYFDTGDDCIAIKSGRNADGRRVNVPSKNIIVRDCTMKDGHGGVVIGSETSGGVSNVFVENCIMDSPSLERALRIKTNSLRGGTVENIFMRKVTVGQVSDAILRINFNYERGDAGDFTPVVRNVYMTEITSEKSLFAMALDGYERSPISNINIESCKFDGVSEKCSLKHVKDLHLNEVFINGELQK